MRREQRELVAAVQAHFRGVQQQLEPRLLAKSEPEFQLEEIRNLQYAQNTLRSCMEAALQLMLPYSHVTAIELAIRLASYSLSIVPMEDQDAVVHSFLQTFVLAHEKRMANGVRIHAEWQFDDGRKLPNFPEAS